MVLALVLVALLLILLLSVTVALLVPLGTAPEPLVLVLLLVPAGRRRMASRWVVVLVPTVALLSLLVPATVLVVLATRLVVALRLLVWGGALVVGLVFVSLLLVRLVAPLVGVAGLGAGALADLAAAALLLLVVLPGSVLLVFPLGLVAHVLIPVAVPARTVLLALALLAVVRGVGLILLLVERFVVGPVVVSCHCDESDVVGR